MAQSLVARLQWLLSEQVSSAIRCANSNNSASDDQRFRVTMLIYVKPASKESVQIPFLFPPSHLSISPPIAKSRAPVVSLIAGSNQDQCYFILKSLP